VISRRPLVMCCVAIAAAVMVAIFVSGRWRYYVLLNSTERSVFRMDQGSNVAIRFYGRVVDESGRGVGGAAVKVELRGINEGWAYESGGANARSFRKRLDVVSDDAGNLVFDAAGHLLIIEDVHHPGYRWLYDRNPARERGKPFGCNWAFEIASDGKPGPYFPDEKSPAQFVIVRDGVSDVRVRPSRGGSDRLWYGTFVNEPVWPDQPSLPDVRYADANIIQRE
jgi:hypothetical protein